MNGHPIFSHGNNWTIVRCISNSKVQPQTGHNRSKLARRHNRQELDIPVLGCSLKIMYFKEKDDVKGLKGVSCFWSSSYDMMKSNFSDRNFQRG